MIKMALQSSEKKTSFSTNGVETYIYMEKMKLDLSSNHEIFNSKETEDLSIKAK